MRDLTIYRWTRGDRYADEDGAFGPWIPREVLFCSEAWMRVKTESQEELGFWSAFGNTPKVTRQEDGTTVFSADNLDGTQRMLETFEPIQFETEDDVADELEETLEDTRCLVCEEVGPTSRVRLETERLCAIITIDEAGVATAEVSKNA